MMKKIIDSNFISNHLTAEDHTEYAPYIQSIYDSTYQKTNINDPKSASYWGNILKIQMVGIVSHLPNTRWNTRSSDSMHNGVSLP